MTEQDSSQSLFVSQQTVQGLSRNLVKSRVGGGEHCEGSLASQSLCQTSSLDSGQQSGELRGGHYQVSNSLGSLHSNSGCVMHCRGVVDSGCMVDHRGMVDLRGMVDILGVMRSCVVGGSMVGGSVVGGSMEGVLGLVGDTSAMVDLALGLNTGNAVVVYLARAVNSTVLGYMMAMVVGSVVDSMMASVVSTTW
jgi:hypothetical protein